MRLMVFKAVSVVLISGRLALADETLYRFEGDRLPHDPQAGWTIFAACNVDCIEAVDNGRFVLEWVAGSGDSVNYNHVMAEDPALLPPSLWVEWSYRSNNPIPQSFYTCDGRFSTQYKSVHEPIYLTGDAVVSAGADYFVTDLPLNMFRTYRFESSDGLNFRISADGVIFFAGTDKPGGIERRLQFGGEGGCTQMSDPTRNEWDFIRYGIIGHGEMIVAADPPAGYLDPAKYANLDRFTVTFDQPNYVYIDDIVVDVEGSEATRQQGREGATAGTAPMVTATRRQDNGPPETVEIVLDRPLPIGQTVRFTFDTGAATPQVVEYTVAVDPHPIIPTASSWGVLILALSLLTAAKLYFPLR